MDLAPIAPVALIAGGVGGLLVGVGWAIRAVRGTRNDGQASSVIVWLDRASAASARRPALVNLSELPVYGLVAWPVRLGSTVPSPADRDPLIVLAMLPPGRRELDLSGVAANWRPGDDAFGVEVAFSDASGRHWLRQADGALHSIAVPAWRHYGLASGG